MGWKLSPPHFCAATETVTDLANRKFHSLDKHPVPIHPLSLKADSIALPAPTPMPMLNIAVDPHLPSKRNPTAYADVFVDDIVGIAQGDTKRLHQI